MMPLDSGNRPAPANRFYLSRRWTVRVLVLVGAVVGLIAGVASCGAPQQQAQPVEQSVETASVRPGMFRKWPKPDVALVLSGSVHGYLLPCGCSHPQVGGMERRYNFLQILKQKGWPVVAVDVGDVPQSEGPVKLPNLQGLIKYRYAMQAMQTMGYSAVGIGEYEANLSLSTVLGEWALNAQAPPKVVVANLQDAKDKFPAETELWQLAEVKDSNIKVGITGFVGRTVAKKMSKKDAMLNFKLIGKAPLNDVLKEMQQEKVDLRVLLYQGSMRMPCEAEPDENLPADRAAEAVECAKAFPQFDVILAVDDTDEPSAEPIWVSHPGSAKKTLVAALGHKGKYIGVIGINRSSSDDKPFEMRYQLVRMTESLQTPDAERSENPIVKLIDDYTKELRANNYLAKYGKMRHSLQVAVKGVVPTYVGSDKCKKCHDSAYEVWKKSDHSHAYQTLVKEKNPSNRQYDPECIVCHTVGFAYQSGFENADKTPHLENVGCENCHGPGSEHVAHPKNKEWQARMNRWQAPDDESPAAKEKRMERIDLFCIECHDSENDVNWSKDSFPGKWKKIAHPTVPE
jgi:hypothetical protein